ncbi:hypothetical protein DBZ36_18480 [Alginatibacterium sediminis]|uniref:DUF695 domain-containing protein n=1 Tax=Alginatibacterium sediminis TaxID=2164068 RepID=A0A420E6G8_9ALTE|nr:hypothetical protein [Alginatibacterium sediminis]RKF13759.1 hypothetical protein DBZ36_18480 [Alginatibacterium sediminis]
MNVIQVPVLNQPEAKSHHKARHLKKMAIGPFAQTCIEVRFEADIEQFDSLDDALGQLQESQGWDLFVAYFNNQFHAAVYFYTEQATLDSILEPLMAVVTNKLGDIEVSLLAGDANYGDWDSVYE